MCVHQVDSKRLWHSSSLKKEEGGLKLFKNIESSITFQNKIRHSALIPIREGVQKFLLEG